MWSPSPAERRMSSLIYTITSAVVRSRTDATDKAFKMTNEMNFGDIEKTKGFCIIIISVLRVIKISL